MEKETIKLMRTAQIFKAIGHPDRIAIIELLAKSKQMSVNEISKALKLRQPVASNQLNTLKNKDVLRSKRVGKNIYYSIGCAGITDAIKIILHLVKEN